MLQEKRLNGVGSEVPGKPISPIILDAVRQLLERVARAGFKEPSVFPDPGGSLSVEWHDRLTMTSIDVSETYYNLMFILD